MPPPAVPPPLPRFGDDDDEVENGYAEYATEELEESFDYEPDSPAPNLPPPSLPAPAPPANLPPIHSNIQSTETPVPPPIPSRRPLPTIPPRNT